MRAVQLTLDSVASFDGRCVELKQGDHIKITASKYPFPTVCANKQSTDWFQATSRTLNWNEREGQKSFVVVEEDPAKEREKRKSTHAPREVNGTGNGNTISPFEDPPNEPDKVDDRSDEDDEDGAGDEEDHEDDFDITDSSPEGAAAAAKRTEAHATSPGENSPPESSRNSSVDSTTTSTGAGADTGASASAGSRIADLGGEEKQHQHNMPIATTPHPDGPVCDEMRRLRLLR